ncbi:phage baseplate assembly protein gpV [Erwinia toletana]|uniref:Phage baseplate assembly protein gpV n=1 Tax=Winslowiella toletana TaxID=92490 RepID=A0ABS4P4Z8_9GAMM|nr:Gp138 family membrane-puncturing spike protein [Winslowiella toletana]MBP2167720.1 phage baseplate assembly protein gpV [Winslowiella toletana]
MPVSLQIPAGGQQQSFDALANSVFSMMRVSLPGIIQSFNAETVTCTVQPAIKGSAPDQLGNTLSTELPLLLDVPVVFPRGGGCTMTFPVNKGDECLVLFSDRCIDFWWQNGGIQEPVDPRMHDLSDAFALVGPQSQAEKISHISTSAVQVRTDDGNSFIELTQGGRVTIKSALVTIEGDLQVNGSVTSSGDQIAAGISQSGHTHGGVQSGGSNTGGPQ